MGSAYAVGIRACGTGLGITCGKSGAGKGSSPGRRQKAREEAEALEQKQGDAGRQARELGDELTRLLTLSNLLKSDMKELDQQIGTADQEYEAAKKEQERRYGMLKKRIRFLYEEGDITYLDILLKARNIGTWWTRRNILTSFTAMTRTSWSSMRRLRQKYL